MNSCNNCYYCGTPEMLIEQHCVKEGSYYTARIIQRCMANVYRYPIDCVMAKMLCQYKEKWCKNDVKIYCIGGNTQ